MISDGQKAIRSVCDCVRGMTDDELKTLVDLIRSEQRIRKQLQETREQLIQEAE